jgi:hypothetical protein
LVIEQLADETLVYDQSRHKAHCLNRTASLVWKQCDGKTSVAQLVALLGRQLGKAVSKDIVDSALADLERAHLLENEKERGGKRITRRRAVRRMAAAGLASMVTTITVPVAAQAASVGQCCNTVQDCRGGLNCVGTGHPECARCVTTGGKCCV